MDEFFDLKHQFNRGKDRFDGKYGISLRLSKRFFDIVNSVKPSSERFTYNVEDRELTLSRDQMMTIYEPVIKGICGLVEDQLKCLGQLGGCEYVMMVGGFSQSKPLRDAVLAKSKSIDNSTELLHPANASTSILRGAVLFGLRPEMVQSRIAGYCSFHPILTPYIGIHE